MGHDEEDPRHHPGAALAAIKPPGLPQPRDDAPDEEWNAWKAAVRSQLGLPQPGHVEVVQARIEDPSASVLLWQFRAGPRRGAWSSFMPSYAEIIKAERRYLGQIGSVYKPLKMRAGKQAAKAARDQAIVAMYDVMTVPEHNRRAVIARKLKLTVGHVGKVLTKSGRRKKCAST